MIIFLMLIARLKIVRYNIHKTYTINIKHYETNIVNPMRWKYSKNMYILKTSTNMSPKSDRFHSSRTHEDPHQDAYFSVNHTIFSYQLLFYYAPSFLGALSSGTWNLINKDPWPSKLHKYKISPWTSHTQPHLNPSHWNMLSQYEI